jgi:hypothetical protein
MVGIDGQAIASPEPILFHHGIGSENEQLGCEILHGDLHGRLKNGNGRRREGLLATRLPEPRSGSRSVLGMFLMALAAATSLLGDGCGRRGLSSNALSVISLEHGTARAVTAAVLPGEKSQTEGLDAAIRAKAIKMRSTGDQRHDRCQPDRPSLDGITAKDHIY